MRLLAASTCLLFSVAAAAEPPSAKDEAAQQFARGQELYSKGQYTPAIVAFRRAHQLAPHPAALFNIARCHENLGDAAKALDDYQRALAGSTEPASKLDIRRRIERLKRQPVEIFVTSQPSGARVTIGGREKPEPKQTPLMVPLSPGTHVLLLSHAGYRLGVQRALVEVGKPKTVDVRLQPEPRPRCPTLRCETRSDVVDPDALRLHLAVMGAIGITSGRPPLAAPGFRAYATYRNFLVGGYVLYFPVGEESIDPIDPIGASGVTYTSARFRQWLLQAEGGYVLAAGAARLELSIGLGAALDGVIFSGEDKDLRQSELVREEAAFAWSVGGTLDATVLRWLSVGVAARFGLVHGDRVDANSPANGVDGRHHFPFATFWGTVALHL